MPASAISKKSGWWIVSCCRSLIHEKTTEGKETLWRRFHDKNIIVARREKTGIHVLHAFPEGADCDRCAGGEQDMCSRGAVSLRSASSWSISVEEDTTPHQSIVMETGGVTGGRLRPDSCSQ